MPDSLKLRVFNLIQRRDPTDRAALIFRKGIFTLIGLNALALMLETVKPIESRLSDEFFFLEAISVGIFTVEYIARLWCCTIDPRYARPILGRLRFACTPLALIDLLAFMPFYLPVLGVDMRFVRVVRLMRWFRLAKVGRYSDTVQSLWRVLQRKREDLVVVTAMVLMVLMLSSTMMYYAENEAQPEKFSSVPAAMWWSVATLTTVGYGDVYPVTDIGRLMAAVVAVLGIGFVALPTGILGAGFIEEIQKESKTCPHCGRDIGPSAR